MNAVDNGWFINEDGVAFAILNGSAYEVDPTGTPLVDLPPGSYTDDEAREALERANPKEKYYGEKPGERDEAGKFSAGGGGGADGGEADAGWAAASGSPIESWNGESPKNPVRPRGDIYKSQEARKEFINDLAEQYGVKLDKPVAVMFDKEYEFPGVTGLTGTFTEQYKDRPLDTPVAMAHGRNTIVLNSDIWGNAERMQTEENGFDGLFASNTMEGVLVHEFGHILDSHFSQSMPSGIETRGPPKNSFYNKWLDKREAIRKKYFDDKTRIPSMYAEENGKEYAAEAFTTMHFNKGMNVAKNTLWSDEIKAPYERGFQASKDYWKEMFQWREDMRKDGERVLRLQARRREREQAAAAAAQ